MQICSQCVECIRQKSLAAIPPDAAEGARAVFSRRMEEVIARSALSAPEVIDEISIAYREIFGPEKDWTPIKRRFNSLMLEKEEKLLHAALQAPDPLLMAVRTALTGNLIDFAALDHVDESDLTARLERMDEIAIDPGILSSLRQEVLKAARIVIFTDNCGEIVTDKVLLHVIRVLNPGVNITAVVRGEKVVNDATEEDARQVRLEEAADRVIGSGSGLIGTVISRLSTQARRAAGEADLILSKGQANYEGLSGCGLNIYYLFMCKCPLFTERFHVPAFSGILCRER